jgi:hypothetical protein
MVLRYWQVGMDWSDSDAVVRAAAKLGFTATRTYPRDQREHHHLNFRREPKLKLRRLLKVGSKGYRVAKMTPRSDDRPRSGREAVPGQGTGDLRREGRRRVTQVPEGLGPDGRRRLRRAEGLVTRRAAEGALFSRGMY